MPHWKTSLLSVSGHPGDFTGGALIHGCVPVSAPVLGREDASGPHAQCLRAPAQPALPHLGQESSSEALSAFPDGCFCRQYRFV